MCTPSLASSQSLSLIYLSVTPFCFQDFGSSVLSLFLILFQVDSLFPSLLFGLVSIYHIPLPAEYFFCLFILFRLLCFRKFVVPFYCGACSLWVGLDLWFVKFSWLGEFASVFWLVEPHLFSLKCNEVSSSEFWEFCAFGMALGSLSFNACCCVLAFLDN